MMERTNSNQSPIGVFESTKKGLPYFSSDNVKLPSLKDLKVLVLPGAFYGGVVEMFTNLGAIRAKTIEEAQVVVFTGGSDVNPALYGEEAVDSVFFDEKRDTFETKAYKECIETKTPMFGICRGAQFLHVMNGGKLWQHVNNHGKAHVIVDHVNQVKLVASSLHHQMVRFDVDMTVLATTSAQVASIFNSQEKTIKLDDVPAKNGKKCYREEEIEAFKYEETQCLGVQGHPEITTYTDFHCWSMHLLRNFLLECSGAVDEINEPATETVETKIEQ